jgi:O-antigen ligase
MALRTPPWVPAALLAIAWIPLGSAPTRAEYSLVVATAATFLVLAARAARGAGWLATGHALLRDVSVPALLGLPLLVLAQVSVALLIPYTTGAPSEMLRAGLVLFSTALYYLLVRDSVRDHGSFRLVVLTIVVVGAVEAAYGLFNLLAGNERLLVYRRWAYHDSATGTLVNRNHFALLMALVFPLTVIHAGLARTRLPRPTTPRSDLRAQRAVTLLASVVVGIALVFSRSRMGVMSFAAACVIVPLAARLLRPAGDQAVDAHRTGMAVPLASAALVVLYVVLIGVTPAIERFANLWTDLETGRMPIWRASVAMVLDRPVFGHGWGSFDFLIDGYRDVPTGLDTSYAHNDYLQVLAEAGIVGFGLVAWMLWLLGRRLVATLASPLPDDARFTVVWLSVAIAAALIHSGADFGLRIPGVGFMFVALLALVLRVCDDPHLVRGHRAKRRVRSSQRNETR